MDYIHESKIFNERASASERVSLIFLTSEYNPYKRGTRVIIYLSYTPHYLYFFGQNFNRPCSFPSPRPLFGHVSTRSGCFSEKVKVKVKMNDGLDIT